MTTTPEHSHPHFERDIGTTREPCWENDLLDRKQYAHQLEKLIANTKGPYVIGMTSQWGSGKTFFLKAWEKDLRERTRPCVYFNAWESDHAEDPLLALTGCITETLRNKGYIDSSTPTPLEATASIIAKKSPDLLINCLFGWGNRLTDGALSEFKEDVVNSLTLGTKAFLANEKKRNDFSKQLKEIASNTSEKLNTYDTDSINGTKNFPLLIMIDELDRCKPTYAIALLESIKHLFNAKGVVFFISIDGDQLLNIVQHIYGVKTEGHRDQRQEYLRKFFDIFWELPQPDVFNFVFSKLKEKRIRPPSDWNVAIPTNLNGITEIERRFMAAEDIYYAILAGGALYKNKILRDSMQALEKFELISQAYEATYRELFTVFDILFSKTNEMRDSDMSGIICRDYYNPANPKHSIRVQPENVDWMLFSHMYRLIIINTYEQSFIDRAAQDANPRNNFIFKVMLEITGKSFSGGQLIESVQRKIKFIDTFHFGADSTRDIGRAIDERAGA